MNVKNALRKLHRWLGLSSGLVVFIVSLTGCIYVFESEIGQLLQTGVWKTVERQDRPVAPPSLWMEKALEAHRAEDPNRLARTHSVELYPQKDLGAITWIRDETGYTAYIQDPWSGEVLRIYKYSLSFWAIIMQLHISLAIPVVGVHIVGIATFVFVAMLVTGLVLWWPRTWKALRPRASFQWTSKSNWKRKNWDLHLVLGFYSSIALVFVAVTGLAMAYGWVDKGIQGTAMLFSHRDSTSTQSPAPFDLDALNARAGDGGADSTIARLVRLHPGVHVYRVSTRATDSLIRVNFSTPGMFARGATDGYGVHRETGRVMGYRLAKDMTAGEIVHEANYGVHTGGILGIPGKILAFFVSLVATTLPITGFLMWWGKKKKKPGPEKGSGAIEAR